MRPSFLILGLCLIVACSYYDSSLLAPVETGEIAGSEGGNGGSGGEAPAGAAGSLSWPGGNAGDGNGGSGGGTAGASQAGAAGTGALGVETQLVGCGVKPIGPPKQAPTKKDGVEFLLAIKTLDFGEKKVEGEAVYKSYGFDLDGYCSCPDDFFCKGADTNTNRYCDGPDGRDNAGGALISTFSSILTDFGSQSISDSALEGSSTILFQVRGYNGEPDDDQVEVAWILGEDLKDTGTPQWNGQDVWPAQIVSFETDKKTPKLVDKNAYVRGNVLVATLPGGTISGGDVAITLTAPFLVGTLIPPDGSAPYWRVDSGTVAARWDTRNILGLLRRFDDPLTKKPLCTDNPVYENIKSEICKFADITLGVQAQPNLPCDALSIALRFTAVEAKLGGLVDVGPTQNKCTAANDPGEDSCDK